MSEAPHAPASEAAIEDRVEREAVAWVQLLLSGEATAGDAQELRRWRARSAAHAAALERARRVWSDIGLAGARSYRHEDVAAFRHVQSRQVIARRAVLGGAIAAAASSYAMLHPPLGLWPSLAELAGDYRTGRGEQRQLTLPDQATVTLNTQTSVAFSRDVAEDRVELINGEASFATPPGAERMLVVQAADVTSSSTRARFGVRRLAQASRMRITCLDGEVRIERNGEVRELAPGDQIHCNSRGFESIVRIDPKVEMAWQSGIVIFQATPLETVIEEINRYRSGRIILTNSALAQKPVSGRFRIDQLDDILIRLEQAFGARVRQLPGGVALLS